MILWFAHKCAWPLVHWCWRQFAAQWGDCKKSLIAPLNVIIIIIILLFLWSSFFSTFPVACLCMWVCVCFVVFHFVWFLFCFVWCGFSLCLNEDIPMVCALEWRFKGLLSPVFIQLGSLPSHWIAGPVSNAVVEWIWRMQYITSQLSV